jgi:hypothetical protein
MHTLWDFELFCCQLDECEPMQYAGWSFQHPIQVGSPRETSVLSEILLREGFEVYLLELGFELRVD